MNTAYIYCGPPDHQLLVLPGTTGSDFRELVSYSCLKAVSPLLLFPYYYSKYTRKILYLNMLQLLRGNHTCSRTKLQPFALHAFLFQKLFLFLLLLICGLCSMNRRAGFCPHLANKHISSSGSSVLKCLPYLLTFMHPFLLTFSHI